MLYLGVASSSTTEHTLNTVNLLGSIARGHGANEEEEDQGCGAKDDELALSRVSVSVLSPSTVGRASVLADLVPTKLVINKTDEGNRVTEKLSSLEQQYQSALKEKETAEERFDVTIKQLEDKHRSLQDEYKQLESNSEKSESELTTSLLAEKANLNENLAALQAKYDQYPVFL